MCECKLGAINNWVGDFFSIYIFIKKNNDFLYNFLYKYYT